MLRTGSGARRTAAVIAAAALGFTVLPASADTPLSSGSRESEVQDESTLSRTNRATRWVPTGGVTFNDPMVGSRQRVIIAKVINAIDATPRGERIRIATWNFDDRNAADALIRAHKRGVSVQVVASAQVISASFARLQRSLRTRPFGRTMAKKSFAMQCKASCRGPRGTGIMHTKFYLFSRIGKVRKISMFGSNNLTAPAANRQWNDMITVTQSPRLHDFLIQTFGQLRSDQPVRPTPYRSFSTPNGKFRVILFPTTNTARNPVLNAFKDVRCRGVSGGAGNAKGRTRIRIAIAGWFDEYGAEIARQVRSLWERGCDIKIVNTLTGKGINQALRAPWGRGPVPTREVTIDADEDEIPEKYLHLKYVSINGVYNGQTNARVVFTGSANWTRRSLRSDEIIVRVAGAKYVERYEAVVDDLYASEWAHARMTSPTLVRGTVSGRGAVARDAGTTTVPQWFEID
jgi:phosphatidylserine/phosphatidylglycerophosphate/cardiolipin synthase-like enzyme